MNPALILPSSFEPQECTWRRYVVAADGQMLHPANQLPWNGLARIPVDL